MTQDLLDDFVRYAQTMKIGREAPPEGVPTVPFQARVFEGSPRRFSWHATRKEIGANSIGRMSEKTSTAWRTVFDC